MNEITIQKSDGEIIKNMKFDFYIEKIFGGKFLGIASSEYVMFYDWDGERCIGKLDVDLK